MTLTNLIILKASLFIVAFLGLPNQAWSEQNQPIQIEADQLDSQDAKGVTRYTGHVVITQGETIITGDQVELIHPERQLNTLTASGDPATFTHYDPLQQTKINGHAQTIIYYAKERKIHLIGHAFLAQHDTHKIQGPRLVYDLNSQTLQAGSTDQQTGRVRMTIEPQQQED